ncbi:MAG: peroxiredoxin family protein [Planctomycetota bacterium]
MTPTLALLLATLPAPQDPPLQTPAAAPDALAQFPLRTSLGALRSPGGELPFRLLERGRPFAIENGAEQVPLTGFAVQGAAWTWRLEPYDGELRLAPLPVRGRHGEAMVGEWLRAGPGGTRSMALRVYGADERVAADGTVTARPRPLFELDGPPLDLHGRWRVRFSSSPDDAVAVFGPSRSPHAVDASELAGTFLTTLGDYRYLAGNARGDQLRLACFDGAHAFLFHATLLPDGTLRGDFWSGPEWHETWTAARDDDARLPDAFTLTAARREVDLGALRYPDATGTERALGDLFGKATLVLLMGTWCPNCSDAGRALQQLQERFRARGLAVVALAFEHGADPARHRRVVDDYRRARGVDWPILLAGSSDKSAASAAFPAIDRLRAYPTILFVDHRGAIEAVHQGFCGPATGDEHVDQMRVFEAAIERLLAAADGRR